MSSSGSDRESKKDRKKSAQPALEYRVTHIRDIKHRKNKPELLLVTLPLRQTKYGMVSMLCDSGSSISLIKLKQLKDDTLIYDEKIALTGITGHKIYALGKA